MNAEDIKILISHLDANAFEELIFFLLKNTEGFSSCRRLGHIGDGIIENPPERFQQTAETFFVNYFPYSIYKKFAIEMIDVRSFSQRVANYFNKRKYDLWLPVDGTRIYTISNYDSAKLGIDDWELLRYYEQHMGNIINSHVDIGLGNINTLINSFNDSEINYKKLIEDFFAKSEDGICISISDEKANVNSYYSQREFDGVVGPSNVVLNPIIKKIDEANGVLLEFGKLINSDCKESVLEEFLRVNYKLIFGNNYDSISTQVWLNFPECDIGKRDRRLDIFMRNSVTTDWELFELKRSNVQLTKTISDVPMFVSAVNDAIAQVKNYKRILSQDHVKKAFEQQGIHYYKPEINLVIGKKPGISTLQWRTLTSEHDLKIITYDTLLIEAKKRLEAVQELLG